ALAADWFDRFEGAGLDGVVAKRLEGTYLPGKRAMLKIKHERTADCVVAGFRWHKNGPGTHVGSLLLGLFDAEGDLHHVGITSSRASSAAADARAPPAAPRSSAMISELDVPAGLVGTLAILAFVLAIVAVIVAPIVARVRGLGGPAAAIALVPFAVLTVAAVL